MKTGFLGINGLHGCVGSGVESPVVDSITFLPDRIKRRRRSFSLCDNDQVIMCLGRGGYSC